jgi:hypothetical protein
MRRRFTNTGLFFLGDTVSLRGCSAISPPTHGGSRPRWHATFNPPVRGFEWLSPIRLRCGDLADG